MTTHPRRTDKSRRGAFREGLGPTEAQWERGHWERHWDTRINGQDDGQFRGWRRQSPIDRWLRDGWITANQSRALKAIDDCWERAELVLTHQRSCLDTTPRGFHSRGGLPEWQAIALQRWEAWRARLVATLGDELAIAMRLLTCIDRCETLYASLWRDASRDARVRRARGVVHKLALAAEAIVDT